MCISCADCFQPSLTLAKMRPVQNMDFLCSPPSSASSRKHARDFRRLTDCFLPGGGWKAGWLECDSRCRAQPKFECAPPSPGPDARFCRLGTKRRAHAFNIKPRLNKDYLHPFHVCYQSIEQVRRLGVVFLMSPDLRASSHALETQQLFHSPPSSPKLRCELFIRPREQRSLTQRRDRYCIRTLLGPAARWLI
jgi:hypothetical protein